MLGAFAGGALLVAALGAASVGVALGVGQLCFAAALVWVATGAERRSREEQLGEPQIGAASSP